MHAFKSKVEMWVVDMRVGLSFATFYCKGVAKDATKHCILLPNEACYTTALHMLEQQFGQIHAIAQALTK